MNTNLPVKVIEDSAAGTRLFFDTYGDAPLEFNAVDVNATQVFFESKGFEKDTAIVIAMTVLKQAKVDGDPVFKILDTLKGFNSAELNILVGEILNNNRISTSSLGFKTAPVFTNETRNISP
jgi:hypothetical protein